MDKFCQYCGAPIDVNTGRCSANCPASSAQGYEDPEPEYQPAPAPAPAPFPNPAPVPPVQNPNSSKKKVKPAVIIAIVVAALLVLALIFTVLFVTIIMGAKIKKKVEVPDGKIDLTMYAGYDIYDAADEIGGLRDEDCSDGTVGFYGNGIVIESDYDDKVSFFCINKDSDYSISGVYYGMDYDSSIDTMENCGYTEEYSDGDTAEFSDSSGNRIKFTAYDNEVNYVEYLADYYCYDDYDTEYDNSYESTQGFDSVYATSVLAPQTVDGYTYNYSAYNLMDGSASTCWAEGADGVGIGEKVVFQSSSEQELSGMCIYNGYCKSESVFNGNNRVKSVKVSFDDGSYFNEELYDGYGNYKNEIFFDGPVRTKSVTIEITGIYSGEDLSDTCISEVLFYY